MSPLWFILFFGFLPISLYAAMRAYDDLRSSR